MAGGFPSWRYGPDGEGIFDCSDDVPAGWVDHPAKLKGGDKPADVVAAVADLAAQVAAMDGDGDGRIGGSRRGPRKVKRNGPGK